LDKETPRDELRAELEDLPAGVKLLRIEADIADFKQEDLQVICDKHEIRRVVCMGKHLCGLGTDLAIEFVHQLTGENSPVVGCIFATCCWNKIPFEGGGQKYLDLYRPCDCIGNFLPGDAPEATVIDMMAKSCSWKCAAQSLGNRMTPEMIAQANKHEALLQTPRRRRLDKMFPPCSEDFFVPESVTMQNRCLVAPSGFNYHPVLDELLWKAIGRPDVPVNLKPKGLISKRFDYDGT